MRAVTLAATALLVASCAGEAADGRPWVRSIEILGNRHFPDGKIKEKIALEKTSWLPFSPKKFFDPVTLEIDQKRIEAFYAAHGYFFARVKSAEAVPAPDGSVDVRIVVEEGAATKIAKVEVKGLERLPEKVRGRVGRQLPLRAGEVFVHPTYLAQKGLIEARLRDEGYAWAEARGVARVDRDRRVVEIEIAVEPGVRARFGVVRVEGETKVERRAVERRAAFREGDWFEPDLLDLTRGRINELGVFSSVRVDYVRSPKRADVADVVVTVRPGTMNEIRLGGGVGAERDRQEIHARVLYTRRNFLGGLRLLKVQLIPAYVFFPNFVEPVRHGPAATAEGSLQQPDFLLRNLSARTVVGYDLGIDYAFRYHGPRGTIGMSYLLARGRLAIDASYNAQFLDFFDTVPTILLDPTLSRNFFGYTDPYRLAYLGQGVTVDLRDRPLDVRKGGYLGVTVEEGLWAIGSAFDYVRVMGDARAYLPLGPRVVVAARLQYGRIVSLTDVASPITRRFYAGGPDSHRGFTYNRLSPQVPSGSELPPVPVGGDQLLLIQAEARVGVVRIKGNMLGVVGFFDAGDVPGPNFGISLKYLNIAVGGGLRYHTVIGTVRFDVAVRLNRLGFFEPDGRQNADPGQRVAYHLSLGETF